MASSWGNSFGTSWGNSWGTILTATTGGWEHYAHESSYNAARQRLERRKEELRRHRQTIRRINRWR